jgi:predicted permease
MTTLFNDLRYGLRSMRKNIGFTAVAVLTMAVGIAANTTVFDWVNATLLHPYPGVGDPARLVALETLAPSGEHITTSYPDYRDLRDATKLLDGIAISQPRALNIGEGVRAQRVWAELVSGDFFDVLRVKPALGRFFAGHERDDAPGGHAVAVISYKLWKTRFHSDPAVLGTTVHVNRYPFTIIGVAPAQFGGSMANLAFDLWAPATMFAEITAAGNSYFRDRLTDRKTRMFMSLARLKPGVTVARGRAEMQSLAQRLAELHDDTNRGIGFAILPVWQASFGAQKTLLAPLGILMGVCVLVLLIACANVTNLLLARATARAKEFSVRLALGAQRGRIARQLLVETLLLALAGSLLGLALADQMRASLIWLLPATSMPTIRMDASLDWRVLLFTEALAVAVTLIAGLVPALQATRMNVGEALKEGGRSGAASAGSHRLRGALVVAEVALAAVALVGAGLFLKSFALAKTINPGFDPRHVAIAELQLSTAGYNATQATAFCRLLRQRIEASPGVEAVSYADAVPLNFGSGSWEDLQVQGHVPAPSENMKIYRNLVAPGYFALMRIPLVDGRDFSEHDDDTSLPVMIVTEEFARRFLPGRNAVGGKVNGWGQWFTIVGVAKDIKYHNLTESPMPFFYIPIRQIYRPEMGITFFVRTAGAPEAAIAAMRQAARATDPDVALFGAEPLTESIAAALFGQKVAASLLSALGLIAVLLAAIGLYSVMAYSIAQRTNEIGIRIALGAKSSDVIRMAVGRGMPFALGGLAIGLLGAVALARLASAALVQVSPADPAIYGAVAVFLGAIAGLASWLPARRAANVDPMACLRVH